MNWEMLIPIVAKYGLPLAEKLFQKWTTKTEPTQADFDELRQLASESAKEIVTSRLVAAGIPLDDPRAIELLSLVK